jgi:hypothetical protein
MKRGIPIVMMVNEDFVTIAKLIAKSKGAPGLPHVVFPRTINTTPDKDVETLMDNAIPQIVQLWKVGA